MKTAEDFDIPARPGTSPFMPEYRARALIGLSVKVIKWRKMCPHLLARGILFHSGIYGNMNSYRKGYCGKKELAEILTALFEVLVCRGASTWPPGSPNEEPSAIVVAQLPRRQRRGMLAVAPDRIGSIDCPRRIFESDNRLN